MISEKKNIDNITENLKKKKTLQMSEVSLEDLDFYETSLKQKMEQELNKYKKNLITTYEYKDLNSSVEIDLEQKLEIKKKKVESDIRIQKERNKNKLENEQNKNKILLEKKIVDLEELNKNKKEKSRIRY
jgi:exonuclease VII large subunit